MRITYSQAMRLGGLVTLIGHKMPTTLEQLLEDHDFQIVQRDLHWDSARKVRASARSVARWGPFAAVGTCLIKENGGKGGASDRQTAWKIADSLATQGLLAKIHAFLDLKK